MACMPKPLMSVPAAAAWLGLTVPMLRSEMARHVDPLPYVEIGRWRKIDPDDALAWRARRRHGAEPTLANDATLQPPPEAA